MPEEGAESSERDRLRRLEEHAAFTERLVDDLAEEIASANRRLQELLKRVEGVERRQSKSLEPETPEGPGS